MNTTSLKWHFIAWWWLAGSWGAFLTSSCQAIESYTEEFITTANWRDAQLGPLTLVPQGGVLESSHVTTHYAFSQGGGAGGTTAVLLRGHDEFSASGNAFVGNWITSQVDQLQLYVRHNAPSPVSYFTRLATPFNFPGATAVQFGTVPPNTWTLLQFAIHPSNPQFVTFEGSNFATVMSNVGHVQFGVEIPAALATDATLYQFDFDQIGIRTVPEPGSLGFAVVLAVGGLVRSMGVGRRSGSRS